jgi:VIT1/CCC1 family predicted Fe2+/Mn2+ transporter
LDDAMAHPSPEDGVRGADAPAHEVPPPPPESHHRNIQGGAARAAVFGISDGLVSNVALILGVAGASPAPGVVRLAGLAGLIAGAVSMSAGEWVSMTAQSELLQRELEMEALELHRHPKDERDELVQIYRSRGIPSDTAENLASEMMRDPDLALETHAREELGIDPNELGSPVGAAVSSFLAFAIGAIIPLLPWLFTRGGLALGLSIAASAAAALGIGAALAKFTGRSVARSALRQVIVAGLAAGVTFVVGALVGVGVS